MNLIFIFFFILIFINAIFACIPIGNKTLCHKSCKTCLDTIQCDDETKCTYCHPAYKYRILRYEKDRFFICSSECNGVPSVAVTKDNFFCNTFSLTLLLTVPTTVLAPIIKEENGKVLYSQSAYQNYTIFLLPLFFFFSLVIAVLFLYCAFKKRKITHVHLNKQNDVERGLINHVKNKPKEKLGTVKPLEIIANPEEISIIGNLDDDDIGSGSYSKVFKGIWKNQSVAVKVANTDGRKSILKEFQIYEKVSHSHIVPALGIHLGIENMLVLALRKQNLTTFFIDYGSTINFIQLKQYSIQVADAMKYLHEKEILHCDLKIDNILVKDEKGDIVEISDFGCAIDLNCDYNPTVNGTRTHLSYEVLKSKIGPFPRKVVPSTSSDVWAFAVTVWQIFSKNSELPNDFKQEAEIMKNYENGKMLPQPPHIQTELWRHVIFPCFNIDPKSRPSMNHLYNSFKKYQAQSSATPTSTSID